MLVAIVKVDSLTITQLFETCRDLCTSVTDATAHLSLLQFQHGPLVEKSQYRGLPAIWAPTRHDQESRRV